MRIAITLLFLLALAVPMVRAEDAKPTISCPGSQKNLRTYRKIHDVLFEQRDASRVAEFYASEVLSHNQDSGGGSVRKVTPAQMGAMWTASKRNNPERHLVDDLILCSGDYIIVRTNVHGQDNVGVAGQAPTHKPFVISGIDIYRFKDGKVVERWGNADLMGQIQQLGFVIAPAPAATQNGTKP
jgi:predicted ester cyclase